MNDNRSMFGEPLAIIGVVEALIAFALTFGPWDNTTQGVIMAVVIAVGAIPAAWGTQDTLLAALFGAIQAVAALFFTFGLEWSDTSQAALIALLTAAVGLYFHRKQTSPEVKEPAGLEAA